MATATMDLFAGQLAQDKGLQVAVCQRADLVRRVRERLVLIARDKGGVATADDFEIVLESIGKSYADLGPAAGAIFKDGQWERTDNFVPSRRKTNNARMIRVWRLRT